MVKTIKNRVMALPFDVGVSAFPMRSNPSTNQWLSTLQITTFMIGFFPFFVWLQAENVTLPFASLATSRLKKAGVPRPDFVCSDAPSSWSGACKPFQ